MLRKTISATELFKRLKEIEKKNKKLNENTENEIKNYAEKIKNIQDNKELKNIENKIKLLELKKNEEKYNRIFELQWKLEHLKEGVKRKKTSGIIFIFASLFGLLITFILKNNFDSETLFVIRIGLVTYLFIGLAFYFFKNDTSKLEEIKEVSDELDYLNSENHSEEIKAEKQFRMYQNELQKYYSQNLSHSQNIFYTGIISIIIGFGIIVYTLWYLTYNETVNNSTQLMLTGGIGGILSNFIGVIYLKMYSETLKVLTAFHNKLVYTQNLHFSNCLLAKIKDRKLKEKVLEEAILEIVKKETIN